MQKYLCKEMYENNIENNIKNIVFTLKKCIKETD